MIAVEIECACGHCFEIGVYSDGGIEGSTECRKCGEAIDETKLDEARVRANTERAERKDSIYIYIYIQRFKNGNENKNRMGASD